MEQDGRENPQYPGHPGRRRPDGPLRYSAHPVHSIWLAAMAPAQYACPEKPPRLHALRPGSAVADQQIPAGGGGFTGHPVLSQPVYLRRKLPGPRQQAKDGSVRGCTRYARILPAPGVQVLIRLAIERAGASMKMHAPASALVTIPQ